MDISNLTKEELEKRLNDLDKTKSPHEALELSNEIGRRNVDRHEFKSNKRKIIQFIRLSPWIALVSTIIFVVTCFIDIPGMESVLVTIGLGILFAGAYVRAFAKGKYGLFAACCILSMITSDKFKNFNFDFLQYITLLTSVMAGTIYLFKNKIENLFENVKS